MRIVADEGIDGPIVQRLRSDGHDVVYIAELSPSVSDDAVLSIAAQAETLLLVEDKDFGQLVFQQGRAHCGVVLIRLAGLSSVARAETVSVAIREHGAELMGKFSVVTPGMIRIRNNPASL